MQEIGFTAGPNWDDGRLFLAVARAGQMLAAARASGSTRRR